MRRLAFIAGVMLGACSTEPSDSVPPLPAQTADTANELMRNAELAASEAQRSMEQDAPDTRSAPATNEVTR